ncbi:GNAT family N-acetyltransferase [Saccharothrix australiensis]|uniref:Acetyltransferase (GNAT) family protein n=1 Tax=Saccharothrix australiensis TaxID=2072 RepID=A0A495W5K8_9PSEU|nr:GNAT family N-acetyltransferase [Saccharothrix australiensis]RKT55943.1 acetyltransferase (GNAT) family protein [Saccharothrix australiensis]
MTLSDGLVLRTAEPRDLDQIGALLTERGEPADAVDHRLVVEDPDAGWEACAVVVDGDRVVSTATLLDETLVLGGVEIPAGQVELVATHRDYEGRGLVRALMGWAHERSAARGQLVNVMLGIPYFYRQFGYTYAIPIAPERPVVGAPPPSPAATGKAAPDTERETARGAAQDDAAQDGAAQGTTSDTMRAAAPRDTVREATADDIPAMARLQAAEQARADLWMPHSAPLWRWLVARDGSTQWLVERDGVPVGTARSTPPHEGVRLCDVAAVDAAAVHALLAHTGATSANERPGTVGGDALEPFLGPAPEDAQSYYVRVADPVALLEHLRPVFGRRLAGSPFADAEGEAVVSFYRSHVRLPYRAGEVGPVVAGGTMQAPGAAGGAGVAPDLLPSLLFGPHGLRGLTARFADVYPGPNADLMHTLFPPVRSDLLTFYMP